MTPKQRLLAAIQGQPVDRVPWSPFLAYWWEAQPQEKTIGGQLPYMESVGADPLLRGFRSPWKQNYKGVNIRYENHPTRRYEFWETPVGTLKFGYHLSSVGNTWFLVEHPIQEVEDLQILQWIYEHLEFEADGAADEEHSQTGERGLYAPLIGSEMKTCFQSLLEKWVGTENLVYFLMDEPEIVEECLATMRHASDKTAAFCRNSAAEAFIFWEDTSTTNINPSMFQQYIAPEISYWAKELHKDGKLLLHHACGSLKALLPMMAETGIDAIESISPPPTGNIDIADAFALLPKNVALIGGIEPVFFQNCTREQLEERVKYLLDATKGRRYVLANSDSCPPAVEEWKFRLVSELVKNR